MVSTEQMKSMRQLSLAETGYLPKTGKQTRNAVFLVGMDTMVPWLSLEALIAPYYPKKGNGRPPMSLSTILRIHFLEQWFGYSDPAIDEAMHDVPLLHRYVELDEFEDVTHRQIMTLLALGNPWMARQQLLPLPGKVRP